MQILLKFKDIRVQNFWVGQRSIFLTQDEYILVWLSSCSKYKLEN